MTALRSSARVRHATVDDIPAILDAIARLAGELRGEAPAPLPETSAAQLERLVGGDGFVLAADGPDGTLQACLVGSWTPSVRLGNRYLFVQDLWIAPEARRSGLGSELITRLRAELSALGITRAEGVFPRPSYRRISETRAFYGHLGIEEIGGYGRLEIARSGSSAARSSCASASPTS